jgi:hypothetical protein
MSLFCPTTAAALSVCCFRFLGKTLREELFKPSRPDPIKGTTRDQYAKSRLNRSGYATAW